MKCYGRNLPTKEVTMKRINAMLVLAGFGQSSSGNPHCEQIGGSILTNLGVIDGNTTLGTATGDLKGAVAATILDISPPRSDNTIVFTVQHHFVTDSGDTITVDVAHAVATPVAPGLVAIVSYPITITGGTGRFSGAHGNINNIGEVDLNSGHTIFRYTGEVCLTDTSEAIHKMALRQHDTDADGKPARMRVFRHDKIRDYFLVQRSVLRKMSAF